MLIRFDKFRGPYLCAWVCDDMHVLLIKRAELVRYQDAKRILSAAINNPMRPAGLTIDDILTPQQIDALSI